MKKPLIKITHAIHLLAAIILFALNLELRAAAPGHGCATCASAHSPAEGGQFTIQRNATFAPMAIESGQWRPGDPIVEVDVMLLYSKNALEAEGNEMTLRQRLLEAIDHTNLCFANSLIGVRLRPVFIGLLNYEDSGNIVTDFERLLNDAQVASLRNDYKADLVYLVVEAENFGFLGIAPLPAATGSQNLGFAVVRRVTYDIHSLPFNLAHETGHLFGAQHDRASAINANFQLVPGVFPYSYGSLFTAAGSTYATVMAYMGIPAPYFSNPNVTFQGVPTGVPAGEELEADNARTINRLAPYVAQYRAAQSRIGFAQTEYRVSEGAGSVMVRLERTGDLNSDTAVTLFIEPSSTATAGVDYLPPAGTRISFAAHQAAAEVTFEILQDDLVEGDETIRLSLRNVQGQHGLSEASHALITILDDDDSFVVTPIEARIAENGGEAEFTVEYRGNLAAGAVRELELAPGRQGDTAIDGVDVEVSPLRLTFTPEARVQTFRVRAIPDTLPEPDEVLHIQAGNAVVRVTILDDDRPGAPAGAVAGLNGSASTIRALPDGRLMVAGEFTEAGGARRTGLARLLPNGELDSSFVPPDLRTSLDDEPGMPLAQVHCLIPDSNGRWIAGGLFGLANGEVRGSLLRFEADGALDPSFSVPGGIDGFVFKVARQPDGKLVVAGFFRNAAGKLCHGFIRLNEDGTADESFRLEPGVMGPVVKMFAVAVFPDGKILAAGGGFERYNNQPVRNIFRLHPDGALDTSFALRNGVSGVILDIAPLPDGRAYVGGYFDRIGDRPYPKLARLNADGSLDLQFRINPPPNGTVHSIHPLPNGQLFAGGEFTMIGGVPRRFVALLNPDGTVDRTFDPGAGAGDHVRAIAAMGDGTVVLGGTFRGYNHQPAAHLARVRLPPISGSFIHSSLNSSGAFQTRIAGLPGARYSLESSVNLLDWEPAGEVRIEHADNMADFEMPAKQERRFFRLKVE